MNKKTLLCIFAILACVLTAGCSKPAPKSSDTTLTLADGAEMTVADGEIVCTEDFSKRLASAQDVSTELTYKVATGATVDFAYDEEHMVLGATVTSEDGLASQQYFWDVVMKKSFFMQHTLKIGSENAIVWDKELDCFHQPYTYNTVRGVYKHDGEQMVAGIYYSFGVDVEIVDGVNNAEFVIEQTETNGSLLRFYMRRFDEGDYRLCTDYLSYNTGWKGYRELASCPSGACRMEVIRNNNSFLMLKDGVVWRQDIAFGATQVIMGGEKCESRLKNLMHDLDKASVVEKYDSLVGTFTTPVFGNDLLNLDTNRVSYGEWTYDEKTDSYTASPTDNKIYRDYLYHNGQALMGQYLIWEADLTILDHNQKINPSVGIYVKGGNSSNQKVLRAWLRIDTQKDNNYELAKYQICFDNGSGTESEGTQKRIRYYGNSVHFKVVFNGKTTEIWVDGVLVFESDGTQTRIADDPEAKTYTTTDKIVATTGFRHLALLCNGAKCVASNVKVSEPYSRVLTVYEDRIQGYLDTIKAHQEAGTLEQGGTLYMGSSFMEFWNRYHNWSTTMTGANVGLGGSVSADWLQLIDRIVMPYAPSRIVLYLSGNDASAQGSEMVPYIAQSIIRVLEELKTRLPDVEIYWVSLLTGISLDEYNLDSMNIINDCIKEYMKSNDWIKYVDIATPLNAANGRVNPVYISSDNVHLNDAGYEIVERIVGAALAEQE
ncbi:MAG: hypothetical protein J6B16_00610 [Clostridia bacterium]|nr:hypothetical protein [Clostridia bacterium]